MGHVYTLTTVATTISLVASGVYLENYAHGTAEAGDETVVDTVDIIISGATGALMQSKAQAISALLDTAQRRARERVGGRVYVNVKLISDTDTWRSELVGGRLELAEDATAVWANNMMRATLYLERVPYWEGPETGIPFTNGNGTWDGEASTGINVYNSNDGTGTSPNKRHNYLQIAANVITGSLPAPVKIELYNATGVARAWTNFYLATNANYSAATWVHMLEAESRVGGGSGTVTANANASGAYELRLNSYSGQAYMDWTISAATVAAANGRWVRVLLVPTFRTMTSIETVQAFLTDTSGSFTLYTCREVALPSDFNQYAIIDLGAMPLPPSGYSENWGALRLHLVFTLASGTANTFLDCLHLMTLDSYRALGMRYAPVVAGGTIVDNGYDRVAYTEASSVRSAHVLPRGRPLYVFPSTLPQRVYVLADTAYSVSWPLDFWRARIWYRPRRVSV